MNYEYKTLNEAFNAFKTRDTRTRTEKKENIKIKKIQIIDEKDDIAIVEQITDDGKKGLILFYKTGLGWQHWYPIERQRIYLEAKFIPLLKNIIVKNCGYDGTLLFWQKQFVRGGYIKSGEFHKHSEDYIIENNYDLIKCCNCEDMIAMKHEKLTWTPDPITKTIKCYDKKLCYPCMQKQKKEGWPK